ncbi:MAG: polyketide cyclase [Gemmatimonadetes bacterium]|nr:polyketide cyclase [Gemmatimonadota bacterium]
MIQDHAPAASERELVITRMLDAPRELVWRAWTDSEQVKQWGPKGFTTPEREMEFRPGGAWHAVMISPDGKRYRQHGVVREVVPMERLVFTFIWDETPDVEMLVSVSFADRGRKTEMVFRQTGFPSDESRDGHVGGWNEAFDRLAEVIASATP